MSTVVITTPAKGTKSTALPAPSFGDLSDSGKRQRIATVIREDMNLPMGNVPKGKTAPIGNRLYRYSVRSLGLNTQRRAKGTPQIVLLDKLLWQIIDGEF